MKKLAPLLALVVAGVALAADPVVTVLADEADAKAALVAHESCAQACSQVKVYRDRLAQAEAQEATAKANRARALAALAAKLGVQGKAFTVRVSTTRDGDGAEVKTVSLVASQE